MLIRLSSCASTAKALTIVDTLRDDKISESGRQALVEARYRSHHDTVTM